MNIDPPETPPSANRRLRPEDLRPRQAAAQPKKNYWVWGSFAALCVLALLIIFFLPDWVNNHSVDTQENVKKSVEVSLKIQAEQRFQEVNSNWQTLLDRGVESWPEAPVAGIQDELNSIRTALNEQQFFDALTQLDTVSPRIDLLLEQQDSFFDAVLSEGRKALDTRQVEFAVNRFELALQITPESPDALSGLKQAEAVAAVDRHMADAENQIKQQQWAEARASYQAALTIDPNYQPAKQGLAEVEQQLSNSSFTELMSEGFQALNKKEYQRAYRAFKQAKTLQPKNAKVASALAQANEGIQQQQISVIRRQAKAAEEKEDWAQATSEYQKALKIDPALSFAKAGLAQSQAIEKTHQQLDTILKNTERLADKAARTNAQQWVQRAQQQATTSPALQPKLEQLQSKIEEAEKQVMITLVSDGETEVTVYKVAFLGRFERHEMTLQAGKYTVKGSRPGYKDVNIVLDLNGVNDQAVYSVRCEELI